MHVNINQVEFVSICPDPVIAINRHGVISVFNPASERLLGYDAGDVIEKMNIREIYPSEYEARKIMRLMMDKELHGAGRLEGYETYVLNSNNKRVPIRLSAAVLMEKGRYQGSVGFFHDMTRQKVLETSLLKQSITDELTSLFNQRHFYVQVAREMVRTSRYGGELSLICIDLDGFKRVNDNLGHLEGDQILRQIGNILTDGMRETDQSFRYGGDEFMVLLPNTSLDEALLLANRIRDSFCVECHYSLSTQNTSGIVVSMSIGVATSSGADPVDYFVQKADMAMYVAKRSGGNSVKPFLVGQD